ncbi:MAG: RnfABCDGE type electron transport complex subunit D [Desulfovibrionaceae bacterium]|nr:RnfABCDGE type electron transport complex subunit D [Desulfovibrionaceae bacterium]
MSSNQSSLLLAMSTPPYWHCGRTVCKRSLDQLAALMPAVIMAVINWGIPALRVMALSVVVCVAVEALCCRVMQRRQTVTDLTAVVSGLLFAFLLPAAAPWWMVALGAACCMLFGKMLFGGLGDNPVSTPLVGWAILFVSYPYLMDANLVALTSDYADPLAILKYLGVARADEISIVDLLLGRQISALGAGQIGGLLIGGAYLLVRGVIRWQISLGVLLGVVVPFAAMQMSSDASASVAFHLCSGSIILCAFYIATDAHIAPTHGTAMVLYGITCGVMIFLIRTFGSYTDGAPFAVLVTCLLTPYFDMIRPKPFGVK